MATRVGRPPTKKGGKRICIRLSSEATNGLDFLVGHFDSNPTNIVEKVLKRAATSLEEKFPRKKKATKKKKIKR